MDEQIHAGFYFYLLTSKSTFVSNATFVYPIVLILLGFLFPNLLSHYNEPSVDNDLFTAIKFILLSYALGFFYLIVPNLYLEYHGKHNLTTDLCLADKETQMQVSKFTLMTILGVALAFLVVFKLCQQKKSERLWISIKSNYWWPNIVLSGSLVVYQFSESLVFTLCIFPLIHSAVHLRGVSCFKALWSLILLVLILTLDILLLFGSFIKKGVQPWNLVEGLTREAILDYECAGSNIWIYVCLHILPSLIILVKILTN